MQTNFESGDWNLLCGHVHGASLLILSHGTAYFSKYCQRDVFKLFWLWNSCSVKRFIYHRLAQEKKCKQTLSRSVKPLPKWLMLFVRLNWCIIAFALSFPLGLLATTCLVRFVLSVICSYHIVSLWLPVYLCGSCFILSNLTRFYLDRTWRTEREGWWEGGKWKRERRSRRSVPPSCNHPCLALPSTTHLSLILGTLRSEDSDGIVNVT